jgi:hypothetical protein
MTVRVFPVRHHGPGSARALAASLGSWEPDAVLIEGPPEANSVLEVSGSPEMRPPVALLAYLPGKPSLSAFYPMSSWSPEWVALQHAVARGVPATMIDLPAGVLLSDRGEKGPEDGGASDNEVLAGDPIGQLAEAAGYDDPERWWEDVVEHRTEEEPWDAVTEAMAELRAHPRGRLDSAHLELEAQREASMRQHIRAAEKQHDRVAVICGAWHAPVLVERGPAKPDQALLAGLPRERATVTWVPWTYTRLAFASGYGAGVTSPGWYEHLYASPDRPIERWMVKVAALLRAEQLDASPASVVEAVRLAEALATMRNRPLAGLAECTDAARSVLGGGYDTVLNLIARRLVVGDAIGEVPPGAPTVPLAADLATQQRRLRLRPESGARALELDLRRGTDLGRSQLLHRLNLLGIPWGRVTAQQRGTGTFREEWALHWEPELSVRAIEASLYGTTVEAAATAKAVEAAGSAADVAEVTRLVEQCLLAELPGALAAVMAALDERSALSTDVGELMDALSPLARVLRYGTVRRTEVAALERVVHGLVARLCVNLGPAMVSLDGTAAEAMTRRISAVTVALAPLPDRSLHREWLGTLAALSATPALHGLPAGRTTRIVFDAELITAGEVARRLSAALSRGEGPAHGASWIEGLLAGSGLLLVHDRALLALVDEWVAWVGADNFNDVLPLLRRTFALFEQGERRLIGEAVRRLSVEGGGGSSPLGDRSQDVEHLDQERAEAVLPLVSLLLGVEGPT